MEKRKIDKMINEKAAQIEKQKKLRFNKCNNKNGKVK